MVHSPAMGLVEIYRPMITLWLHRMRCWRLPTKFNSFCKPGNVYVSVLPPAVIKKSCDSERGDYILGFDMRKEWVFLA